MNSPVILRDPKPGDLGWVVHRHGALYAAEYGWDQTFEAKVAGLVGTIADRFDPAREMILIAERVGAVVGSAFLVARSADVAQLRLVYVEPGERGTGLGRRLVEACLDHARRTGYRAVTLWTNDPLVAARRLYASLGFRLVEAEPVRAFGHAMISEIWTLEFDAPAGDMGVADTSGPLD